MNRWSRARVAATYNNCLSVATISSSPNSSATSAMRGKRQNTFVAGNDQDCAELRALRQMHRSDEDGVIGGFVAETRCRFHPSDFCHFRHPREFVVRPARDADFPRGTPALIKPSKNAAAAKGSSSIEGAITITGSSSSKTETMPLRSSPSPSTARTISCKSWSALRRQGGGEAVGEDGGYQRSFPGSSSVISYS